MAAGQLAHMTRHLHGKKIACGLIVFCILDCVRTCEHGGTLDEGNCMCNCPGLFSGPNCECECTVYQIHMYVYQSGTPSFELTLLFSEVYV